MIHYRVSQLKLPIQHNIDDIKQLALSKLHLSVDDVSDFYINKKSIDARDKSDIKITYSVDVIANINCSRIKHMRNIQILNNNKSYEFISEGKLPLKHNPIIVGSGPAGLFCSYLLAKSGYKPIIIERGEAMDERIASVNNFWENNILNTESNVQFGEGGAGTFSDGKLNTGVNDKYGRNKFVLDTFVKFGAPENILYDSKPHIGTDILSSVIKNMRNEIINLGGTFLFNTKFTDFIKENQTLTSIKANNKIIKTDILVLALGHSSRDTFCMLKDSGVYMEPKPFAMGVRVAHSQDNISKACYGNCYRQLPAADYKLTTKTRSQRAVFSFCMCPGGYVVNASSENGRLAINGMSYSGRDSQTANSAIVTTISIDDYYNGDVLSGMYFQQQLEEAAYKAGKGSIPTQLYKDFISGNISSCFGNVISKTKGNTEFCDINKILPSFMSEAIKEGIKNFSQSINGFDNEDTIIYAIESRTSSPIRILRDENYEANIKGIYPCGEGAGYAGGITSAAIDGIKTAEAIAKKYKPFSN
ncbi:MAG: NAD(P)/FAD-dependent oxidoreductase [Eubacterium sp.]